METDLGVQNYQQSQLERLTAKLAEANAKIARAEKDKEAMLGLNKVAGEIISREQQRCAAALLYAGQMREALEAVQMHLLCPDEDESIGATNSVLTQALSKPLPASLSAAAEQVAALRAELAEAKLNEDAAKTLLGTVSHERDALRSELAASNALVEVMRGALEMIAEWKLPETGEFWESGAPISYETNYGIQGVRNYFQSRAIAALSITPSTALSEVLAGECERLETVLRTARENGRGMDVAGLWLGEELLRAEAAANRARGKR